jgi:hypothetical protein
MKFDGRRRFDGDVRRGAQPLRRNPESGGARLIFDLGEA